MSTSLSKLEKQLYEQICNEIYKTEAFQSQNTKQIATMITSLAAKLTNHFTPKFISRPTTVSKTISFNHVQQHIASDIYPYFIGEVNQQVGEHVVFIDCNRVVGGGLGRFITILNPLAKAVNMFMARMDGAVVYMPQRGRRSATAVKTCDWFDSQLTSRPVRYDFALFSREPNLLFIYFLEENEMWYLNISQLETEGVKWHLFYNNADDLYNSQQQRGLATSEMSVNLVSAMIGSKVTRGTGITTYKNYLYAFGNNNVANRLGNQISRFNLDTKKWEMVHPYNPNARGFSSDHYHLSGAFLVVKEVVDDQVSQLLVCLSSKILVFSIPTKTWSTIEFDENPFSAFDSAGVIATPHCMFIFDNDYSTEYNEDDCKRRLRVFEYNFVKKSWVQYNEVHECYQAVLFNRNRPNKVSADMVLLKACYPISADSVALELAVHELIPVIRGYNSQVCFNWNQKASPKDVRIEFE